MIKGRGRATLGGLFILSLSGCGLILGLDEYTRGDDASSSSSSGSGGSGGGGQDAGEPCVPGSTEACYDGPEGTQDKGSCKAGVRTCNAEGTAFGPCESQVLPSPEDCATPLDEDCNGTAAQCTGAHIWSARFGNTMYTQDLLGLAADSTGAGIISGALRGDVDLGGGVLTTKSNPDAFVAKFDADGKHVFSKRYKGISYGYGVGVDSTDNIVLAGTFLDVIDLGGGNLQSMGSEDIFLVKLDAKGDHVWSRRFGGTGQQIVRDVAIDADGNILLAGEFNGPVDFGGGVVSSAGQFDAFVAKLTPSGEHIYSIRFGTPVNGSTYAEHISVDSAGNAIVTGDFSGQADFDDVPIMMTGASLFVAYVNPTGKVTHVKGYGLAGDFFTVTNVAASGPGDAVLVGSFTGDVNFGGSALMSMMGEDVFMAKLSPTAEHIWSVRYGDTSPQRATGVAVNALGHIAVVGTFTGKLDFEVGPLTTVQNAGDNIFATKLDGTGKGIWSKQFGVLEAQYGKEVAMDPSGSVLLAGTFKMGVSFGGPPLNTEGAGAVDIYVARLAP
jgi:hypothetical protein